MNRRCDATDATGKSCPNQAVPGSHLCRRHLGDSTAWPVVGGLGGALLGHLIVPWGLGAVSGAVLGTVIGSLLQSRRKGG